MSKIIPRIFRQQANLSGFYEMDARPLSGIPATETGFPTRRIVCL